jgi:cell shape-determining protein MreC
MKPFIMPIKTIALLVALLITPIISLADSEQDATSALQKATSLWTNSKELGFEWNTVAPLMDKAHKAFESKQYTQATQFANQASQQAQLSIEQAKHEETNWLLNLPH